MWEIIMSKLKIDFNIICLCGQYLYRFMRNFNLLIKNLSSFQNFIVNYGNSDGGGSRSNAFPWTDEGIKRAFINHQDEE